MYFIQCFNMRQKIYNLVYRASDLCGKLEEEEINPGIKIINC